MKNAMGKRRFALSLALLMLLFSVGIYAYALDGIWHKPYGIDGLYSVEETERFPRDPVAGEDVFIKMNTWPVEMGQSTWVTYTKNGVSQPAVGGQWKYNSGNNTYWEANLGSFSKGDVISYYVHANKDGANEKVIGPFEFTVTDWEYVSSINGYTNNGNAVVLNGVPNTGTFTPKINITFPEEDVFRVQLSPNNKGSFTTGLNNYSVVDNGSYLLISTSKLKVRVEKSPYRMKVYDNNNNLIAQEYDSSITPTMGWLTDGKSIIDKVENHFYTPTNEQFYGFGERYNNFAKRGQDVDTYVYNQYRNQDEKTYMAIPFFVNTNGYGVLLNTTHYSKFKLATERTDMYSFTADANGKDTAMLDYHFFYGNDLKDVVSNYTAATERPTLMPKWAFGLWMSANEWDRQSEVLGAIDQANYYNIPASVLVLEQWSDENTFYIFNEAQYTPKSGDQAFSYNDFTFGSKWPDPKYMVNQIHNNNMKVLLWQVPVQKYTSYSYTQKDNDEAYMINQGYAVSDGNGGVYRTPEGTWFGNSPLLDFTNPAATQWWMSKRAYLMDDIGIDGFKTDGGEMLWGRWNTFSDGRKGDEMRNQYPNEYIRAYFEFARSKKADAITFSRAGTTGVQKYPAFWAGDQDSSFYSYQQAMMAGMSANISGVPFWTWDLAGFTGNFPSAELYKRSTSMSTFMPLMQLHSEKADPSVSEERTPWNVASRTGDSTVISTFRKYANVRMNLLPYIYSEAKKTSDTGVPLMRAMVMEYPKDTNTHNLTEQYMFGDNLLVAPVAQEGQTMKDVYLPEGEWIDLWWGAQRPGNRTISYYAGVDDIPVFVKAGSILPLDLNGQYELGGNIGNDLSKYTNLTFRVYPSGSSSYQWFDDLAGNVKTVSAVEDYPQSKVSVTLPAINTTSTVQVYTSKPTSVTVGSTTLMQQTSLTNLIGATQGWYYDTTQKLVYVKVASGTSNRTITLNGVKKAAYEAEYATLNAVTTNSNHAGYLGSGFVDGFATAGDSVEFEVYAKTSGSHTLDLRYGAGTTAATRGIYVNGSKVQDMNLPKTTNWDTWGNASITVQLNQGLNKIKVQYDSGNVEGINLDGITIR